MTAAKKTKFRVPMEWYVLSSIEVDAESMEDAIEAVEVLLHNEVPDAASDYQAIIKKVSADKFPGLLSDYTYLISQIEEIGHGGATKRATRKARGTGKVVKGDEAGETPTKAPATKSSVPASGRRQAAASKTTAKAPAKATTKATTSKAAPAAKEEAEKKPTTKRPRPQRGAA